MCKYYRHTFDCKHNSLTFARFCHPANLKQTPCKSRRDVWHTIFMDEPCDDCRMWNPDRYPVARRSAAR